MTKSYSELRRFKTFDERFNYLKLTGRVGESTFGSNRWMNQYLYNSDQWKEIRDLVIIRDKGCDLGIEPILVRGRYTLLVHHINPITVDDIENRSPKIFDLDNLITTMYNTHRAIHYGNSDYLKDRIFADRRQNDTSPWL